MVPPVVSRMGGNFRGENFSSGTLVPTHFVGGGYVGGRRVAIFLPHSQVLRPGTRLRFINRSARLKLKKILSSKTEQMPGPLKSCHRLGAIRFPYHFARMSCFAEVGRRREPAGRLKWQNQTSVYAWNRPQGCDGN